MGSTQPMDRILDTIVEPAQKLHVINKYLIDKDLIVRIFPYDKRVLLKKANADGTQIAVFTMDTAAYSVGQKVTFYTLLNKYIQLDCTVKKIQPDGIIFLVVTKIGIAKSNRFEPRIPNNGLIHASNLITAKTVIEANMFQIPTLVKVAFDEFKTRLDKNRFEFVKIDVFKPDLAPRFLACKKLQKPLWIENTQKKESYFPSSDKVLGYAKDVDADWEDDLRQFRENVIVSEAIVPIIYGEPDQEKFPMGYIWVQNREHSLSPADLVELVKFSENLVQRILESNTMKVETKIPVMDASRSGLQIQVEDENLIRILPKQKRVVLDIVFKKQSPFTVMGDIKWVQKKTDNKLLLGLQLESKSDLPGERARYIQNLEKLEQEILSEK